MTTLAYFGTRWDAPMLVGAKQLGTPVGKVCHWCEDLVVIGDRGLIHPVNDEPADSVTQIHAECWMDQACGHLVGLCSCSGLELSRDRARKVWARFFDNDGRSLWAEPVTL